MISIPSDSLPDEEELDLIARLRERFASVFAEREQRGQLYPALFGDLALTRILRQNKADLEASSRWLERFFDVFAELRGDEVMPDMVEKMEAIKREGRLACNDDLPGYDSEMRGLFSLVYNFATLSKTGDPLSFFPASELNKPLIMARCAFDRYERVVLHGWLMRAIELDQMSREQGRLCRVVNIIDTSGCTLSKVVCRDFDRLAEKMLQRLEQLVPDLTAANFVINAPWVVQKIFPWAKRMLKIKVDNWYLCQGDGEKDDDLLKLMSVETLRAFGAFRKSAKEEHDQQSADHHYIARGAVLEHGLEVRAGQRVSWKFVVLPGGALLPPTEVDFGVSGVWDTLDQAAPSSSSRRPRSAAQPVHQERAGMVVEDGSAFDLFAGEADEEDDYQGLQEEVLCDVQRCSSVDPENSGSLTADRAGMVVLRWSNEFNLLRAKRVKFSVFSEAAQAFPATAEDGCTS